MPGEVAFAFGAEPFEYPRVEADADRNLAAHVACPHHAGMQSQSRMELVPSQYENGLGKRPQGRKPDEFWAASGTLRLRSGQDRSRALLQSFFVA